MHTDVTQDRKYLLGVFFNLREISIARRFRISAHTSIGTFPWKAFFSANILCEYSASERETYFLVYPARSSHLAYILLLFLIAMQSLVLKKCNFSLSLQSRNLTILIVTEHSNKYRSKLLRDFVNEYESHAITYEIIIFSSTWKNIQLSLVIICRCNTRHGAISREMLKRACAWKLKFFHGTFEYFIYSVTVSLKLSQILLRRHARDMPFVAVREDIKICNLLNFHERLVM